VVSSAYSSDLNPTEQAFAKVKHWMKNCKTSNRKDMGNILDMLADLSGQFPNKNTEYASV